MIEVLKQKIWLFLWGSLIIHCVMKAVTRFVAELTANIAVLMPIGVNGV